MNTKSHTLMDQLGHSPNALEQRQAELLALIRQVAPEVMSDHLIDGQRLKELLGHECFALDEHYELNWAGNITVRG